MRVRTLRVLQMAIDQGVELGIRRYYKHRDAGPSEQELNEMSSAISTAIQLELDDWFTFSEEGE
jgi:hypothetical protein